jgi:hypothetical protein
VPAARGFGCVRGAGTGTERGDAAPVGVRQTERSGRPIAIQPAKSSLPIEEQFVPVSLPPDRGENVIRIEVRRNRRSISIEWPASAAHQCALLLRELAK